MSCVVCQVLHSAKQLPECFWAFAEYPWHSAKLLYPVVDVLFLEICIAQITIDLQIIPGYDKWTVQKMPRSILKQEVNIALVIQMSHIRSGRRS